VNPIASLDAAEKRNSLFRKQYWMNPRASLDAAEKRIHSSGNSTG
jgi:hypothetical protein